MGPVLAVVSPWLPVVPGELLSVGLTLVLPVEGKLRVAGEDADEGGATGLELPDVGRLRVAGVGSATGLELPDVGKLRVAGEDADEGGATGLELPDAVGDVATLGLAV